VVAARRRLNGESASFRVNAISDLARAYFAAGRYGDAKGLYLELLDLMRRTLGDDDPKTISQIQGLVSACDEVGDYKTLVPLLPILKRAAERSGAEPSSKNSYAWTLLQMPAELRDAQAALRIALEAAEATERKNAAFLDTLALAYYRTGRTEEAARTQAEAIALLPPGPSRLRDQLQESLARYERARASR
jgi:tetratricopeptide (TPR) repeat protein